MSWRVEKYIFPRLESFADTEKCFFDILYSTPASDISDGYGSHSFQKGFESWRMKIRLSYDGREDLVLAEKCGEDNRINQSWMIREDNERGIRLEVFGTRKSDTVTNLQEDTKEKEKGLHNNEY